MSVRKSEQSQFSGSVWGKKKEKARGKGKEVRKEKGEGNFGSLGSKELIYCYVSNTDDHSSGQNRKGCAWDGGGCTKVGQHLPGADFPVQVHDTSYGTNTEMGSRNRQEH